MKETLLQQAKNIKVKRLRIKTSEFGKGFIYNLILFAAHFERRVGSIRINQEEDYSLWFNGASDHLFDLKIPNQWKNLKIGKIARKLKNLALEIGHGGRMMEKDTKKEFEEVQAMTKELGLLIDEKLGLKPIKGQWE